MTTHSTLDQPETIDLLFSARSVSSSPCPASAEEVGLEIAPGHVLHCRYYSTGAKDTPVLFICPATINTFPHFDSQAEDYLRHGLNVFLISYRGFANNTGSPSVGSMLADSRSLFQLAAKWLKDKGCIGPIFLMGQSLGSLCAIDTAWKNGEMIKGLIIESGICAGRSFLEAMGIHPGPKEIADEEDFRSIEKITEIKTPTLIFHGARDQLVAVAEAEKLQASSGAKTKQFFIIPGADHHSVGKTGGDLYIETIKQFTDTVCGVNTWRQKRREHRRKKQG